MRGKRKSLITSFISVIIVLLVIALAVGLIVKYTGIVDKIKDLTDTSFRVKYIDNDFKGEDNKIALPNSGQVKFTVKGRKSYIAKVIANVTAETDFTYTVGDEEYRFSQTDLTDIFLTNADSGNGYCVNCLESYDVKSVLSKQYNGVQISEDIELKYPYKLIFVSGKETISFIFGTLTPAIYISSNSIIF